MEQVAGARGRIAAYAMIAAVVLPSLQIDLLYFTSAHGNRDRLSEAMRFIGEHRAAGDRIFLLRDVAAEEARFCT